MSSSWRQQCRAAGIAPDLIERIASRYRAYATHRAGRDDALQLAAWFKWYALENAAQMQADRVQVDACSVPAGTRSASSLDRSEDILKLVRLRLSHKA